MQEKETVRKLKHGDQEAFAFLYNHYWKQVYNFTRLYFTASMDIEEIVQEVFVKVWESHHFLDENKSFEGYLFIITRNVIFNHSRRYYKETALKITAIQAVEESYDMEGELDAADLKKYIDELVMQLPRQREVFRMSRELHMSNREIAEHFSITEKAIERHINLALKFLKRTSIYSCCLWQLNIQPRFCHCTCHPPPRALYTCTTAINSSLIALLSPIWASKYPRWASSTSR